MNKKLEVKDFELVKVKFNSANGLDISWFDLNQKNDLYNVSSDSQPSNDYLEKVNELKEIFAYSLGLHNGWDFSRENVRNDMDVLKKAISLWNEEVDRVKISGLVVVGADAGKGIKITGSLKTELGVIGLSSPTIRFDSEITNCNSDLIFLGDMAQKVFNDLQKEVWSFIYKGKRGGELFPETEKIEGGLNGVVKMQKVG